MRPTTGVIIKISGSVATVKTESGIEILVEIHEKLRVGKIVSVSYDFTKGVPCLLLSDTVEVMDISEPEETDSVEGTIEYDAYVFWILGLS